jgi:hypothetical protein
MAPQAVLQAFLKSLHNLRSIAFLKAGQGVPSSQNFRFHVKWPLSAAQASFPGNAGLISVI